MDYNKIINSKLLPLINDIIVNYRNLKIRTV